MWIRNYWNFFKNRLFYFNVFFKKFGVEGSLDCNVWNRVIFFLSVILNYIEVFIVIEIIFNNIWLCKKNICFYDKSILYLIGEVVDFIIEYIIK